MIRILNDIIKISLIFTYLLIIFKSPNHIIVLTKYQLLATNDSCQREALHKFNELISQSYFCVYKQIIGCY